VTGWGNDTLENKVFVYLAEIAGEAIFILERM
jgi:hypothetical protein